MALSCSLTLAAVAPTGRAGGAFGIGCRAVAVEVATALTGGGGGGSALRAAATALACSASATPIACWSGYRILCKLSGRWSMVSNNVIVVYLKNR